MIVKFDIHDDETGEDAILQYDDDPNQKAVVWGLLEGTSGLKKKLIKYFAKEQDYKIPVKEEDDEYEIQRAKPVQAVHFFEMAMSEMMVRVGVRLGKVLNVEETE